MTRRFEGNKNKKPIQIFNSMNTYLFNHAKYIKRVKMKVNDIVVLLEKSVSLF